MDGQSSVDGEHADVEGHVVGGTGGQAAVARIDREPYRFAILVSTLDGGRENNRARDGTGWGASYAVPPPE